jgi:asparagine synthase (glutamine-hydrolysing)
MCGINGLIGFGSESERVLHLMNDSISHRGPDSNGIWIDGSVALGHVRLSVIDLSERSGQPFIKDGLVVVFNGEIYNYRALRDQIQDVKFKTESDTEVVLEAWRKWGGGCLNRFRGMFSFSIHDMSSGETFIARDQFGIKPLFYRSYAGKLVFSSELKSIEVAATGLLDEHIDAVAASLLYVWLPEEVSIRKGVSKLSPGSYLKVDSRGNVSTYNYWNSKELLSSSDLIKNESQAVELLDDVLHDSVKKHLVSDVPVNAFLSGGLDSSLIVAMARDHLPSLDCFTIKFSNEDKKHESMADDAHYAQLVANELDVRLNTIEVSPDLTELLPKIVHHLDEPIGDSAAISTFLICEAARDSGVKVLLSGMGADELFAGYRKHYANNLAAHYRKVPRVLRWAGESVLDRLPVSSSTGGLKLIRWAKRFTSFAGLSEPDAFLRSYTYYDRSTLEGAFEDDVTDVLDRLISQHHATFMGARGRGLVDAMCYTDVNRFMTSLNLTYSDRASMAASTEIRVPFVDKEVVKAAFSIDSKLKLKGREQKYILKKVAEKWLPKEVIYRPKSSFTMPLRAWIKRDLGEMVDDYLLSSDGLSGRKILKKAFIQKVVQDERSGREDNAQKIWHLLTLEQWFRNREA